MMEIYMGIVMNIQNLGDALTRIGAKIDKPKSSLYYWGS